MRRRTGGAPLALLLAAGSVAATLASTGVEGGDDPPRAEAETVTPAEPAQAPLPSWITVTSGAAAGYVPDRACGLCHQQLFRSYQEVGMSRAFYRPRADRVIEDFDRPAWVHEPSGRHYEMNWRDDRLFFRRHQLDESGLEAHAVEIEVDWILGSGHHARTYLYRTPAGELYQLPVTWYTQSRSWGMAPGFDRADHEGLGRQVQRECMVCHNTFPDVPAGSDRHGQPHRFPEELPEGLGCQRCHGPGEGHVRAAFGGGEPREVRQAIVHPGRLAPERLLDVCYQCHMQPSAALPGVRRFERTDYAFRPGEALAAHRVELDPVGEGRPREERFEINHHPYRLEQSACFQQSGGKLTCLTCHDPHRKVPQEARAAHYRASCESCHTQDACALDQHREGAHGAPPASAGHAAGSGAQPGDCVACHMPRRRTQDVVHVVMTDHRIQRQPAGPEAQAMLEETTPTLTGVDFLWPERAPPGPEGEIYRAVGALRIGATEAAVPYLERLLASHPQEDPEPYLRLAQGQLFQQRFAAAETTLRHVLPRVAGDALPRMWLGLAAAGQGRGDEAVEHLRAALALDPDLPEAHFNLGRVLIGYGEPDAALPHLERAVHLRPPMIAGWLRLGEAAATLGRREEAVAHYRRALEMEPSTTDAYLRLAELLRADDREAESEAVLRLGRRFARYPERLP